MNILTISQTHVNPQFSFSAIIENEILKIKGFGAFNPFLGVVENRLNNAQIEFAKIISNYPKLSSDDTFGQDLLLILSKWANNEPAYAKHDIRNLKNYNNILPKINLLGVPILFYD
jgi:hypothetical protein